MCGLLTAATGVVQLAAAGAGRAQAGGSAGAATSEGLGQPTPTRSCGGQRQHSYASASFNRRWAAVIVRCCVCRIVGAEDQCTLRGL